MILSLRRRFVAGAMAAFLILLLLLIVGTAGIGYLHLQYQKNNFLDEALDTEFPSNGVAEIAESYFSLEDGHHSHGKRPAASHCLIDYDTDGNLIGFYSNGMRTVSLDQLKSYVQRIRESGTNDGDVDGYIYRIRTGAEGMRIVIMDFCLQEQTFFSTLRTVIYLSCGCAILLFIILIPVSRRMVLSYAAHIEKQRQFITNAGHDLKTPVAIIRSNVDAQELICGETKWSKNVREQSIRLNRLIEQMLSMARMEEDKVKPAMDRIDFAGLLRSELETYQPLFQAKPLEIETEIAMPCTIRGNSGILLQLLHILLDNAVQYSNPGGRLSIVLRKKCLHMQLVFENSVEALPDCPPEKLFDRFYRADSARTQKSGGSGIGLAAAQQIVSLHRGKIDACYTQNPGLRFTIELPLR